MFAGRNNGHRQKVGAPVVVCLFLLLHGPECVWSEAVFQHGAILHSRVSAGTLCVLLRGHSQVRLQQS